MIRVPLLDLRRQYASLRQAVRAKFDQLADAQAFVLGPEVEALENSIAALSGAAHAIGVSSGTDAQLVLMMALGIGPGDKVLTTPYTFFATAGCIARLGATPVFCDIAPDTYNLDPALLSDVLDRHPDTKAIIPVHLFGCCADMERILAIAKERSIPVLEDAAQSLGANHPLGGAGAMGDAAWFSFYPTKNLGAFGDAGMVACRDAELASRIKALRNHGMEPRYYHKWIGGNFRLDALQAAILNIKLPHLAAWSDTRRALASRYADAFRDLADAGHLTLPHQPYADLQRGHIFNQFIIRTHHRDALRKHLADCGIGTEIYYPLPLHLQECFAYLGHREGAFPESERAAKQTLALPIFPELTPEEHEAVVASIRDFFA